VYSDYLSRPVWVFVGVVCVFGLIRLRPARNSKWIRGSLKQTRVRRDRFHVRSIPNDSSYLHDAVRTYHPASAVGEYSRVVGNKLTVPTA
jgi:hypothetical protein